MTKTAFKPTSFEDIISEATKTNPTQRKTMLDQRLQHLSACWPHTVGVGIPPEAVNDNSDQIEADRKTYEQLKKLSTGNK